MPKPAECTLTIDENPDPQGFYHLTGQASRKQVRRKNKNLGDLEALKDILKAQHDALFERESTEPVLRKTRLSHQQMLNAENLMNRYGELPLPLEQYIEAGMKILGDGSRTPLRDSEDGKELGAISQWADHMANKTQVNPKTVDTNRRVVAKLLETNPEFVYVCDITPKAVDDACYMSYVDYTSKKLSGYTVAKRMGIMDMFFRFCMKQKFIRTRVWDVDEAEVEKQIKRGKKAKADPVVLSGEEAHALLAAAIRYDQKYIPYVICSLWCFGRPSEVVKVTTDKVRFEKERAYVQLRGDKWGTKNYREADIPAVVVPVLRKCIEDGIWPEGEKLYFSINSFRNLRAKAGLLELSEEADDKGFRKVIGGKWVADIMRHTGISMLYQKIIHAQEKIDTEAAIKEVNRQADNSKDVAFLHYIKLTTHKDMVTFFSETQAIRNFIAQRKPEVVNW